MHDMAFCFSFTSSPAREGGLWAAKLRILIFRELLHISGHLRLGLRENPQTRRSPK